MQDFMSSYEEISEKLKVDSKITEIKNYFLRNLEFICMNYVKIYRF